MEKKSISHWRFTEALSQVAGVAVRAALNLGSPVGAYPAGQLSAHDWNSTLAMGMPACAPMARAARETRVYICKKRLDIVIWCRLTLENCILVKKLRRYPAGDVRKGPGLLSGCRIVVSLNGDGHRSLAI